MDFNLREIFSATIVLFAVLDILGSLPIIIGMVNRGLKISALQTSSVAFAALLAFMFLGEAILGIFGVDLNSFAVAGAIVLFIVGMEMVLGREIMSQDGPGSASIVPLAFPLLAGPGSFTTILALRAEYATLNVVLALVVNIVFIFVVLRSTEAINKLLGTNLIYVMKKFFGLILLAISVRLFTSNLAILLEKFGQ